MKTVRPQLSSTSKQATALTAGFAGQIIAGVGAAFVLLGPFGTAFAATGLALMLVGVIISAPHARQPGPFLVEWWTVLAVATMVCLVGFALGFAVDAAGIVSAAGAIAALIAVGLGSPPQD